MIFLSFFNIFYMLGNNPFLNQQAKRGMGHLSEGGTTVTSVGI